MDTSSPWSLHWLSRWQVQVVVVGQGIHAGSQWPNSTCCLQSGPHTCTDSGPQISRRNHPLPSEKAQCQAIAEAPGLQICIQISHLPRGPAPRVGSVVYTNSSRGGEAGGPLSEVRAAVSSQYCRHVKAPWSLSPWPQAPSSGTGAGFQSAENIKDFVTLGSA